MDMQWYRTAIDKKCETFQDAAVLRCFQQNGSMRTLLYGELARHIHAFSAVMERVGLHPGDRAILECGDLFYDEMLFAACAYWHVILVPLDMSLPLAERDRLSKIADARAVFTDIDTAQTFDAKLRDQIPFLDVCAPGQGYPLLFPLKTESVPASRDDEEPETVMILFSSGTTREIEPVLFSYGTLYLSTHMTQHFTQLRGKQEFLFVFPFNHITATSGIVAILIDDLRVSLDMFEKFTPECIPEAFRIFQPTIFGMVPKVFDIMVKKLSEGISTQGWLLRQYYHFSMKVSAFFQKTFGLRGIGRFLMTPFRDKLFGKNMRFIFTGSTQSLPETAATIMNLGIIWLNVYGSTECGVPITTTAYQDRYDTTSVGLTDRYPEHIQIKIHEPDENGNGEIYVRSKLITKGYFRDPQLTAEAFDGEWFRTGDNGYIDENKRLHIIGRTKEVICMPTGKKIQPQYLESVLLDVCPKDLPVVICAIPDSNGQFDEIHAFFETGSLTKEQQYMLRDKILLYAHAKLPMYPIEAVHFVREIPKTTLKKVKRYLLADMIREETQKAEEREETEEKQESEGSDFVEQTLRKYAKWNKVISDDHVLYTDLGIDSLGLFSVLSEIELKYGIDIAGTVSPSVTVGEIRKRIANAIVGTQTEQSERIFPQKKRPIHQFIFRGIVAMTGLLWKVEVSGLENLPPEPPYLMCPNHQSNLDTFCLLSALGKRCPPWDQMAALMISEYASNAFVRFFSAAFGGIPVDWRNGLDRSAKDGIAWLRRGGWLLLFPEGSRTEDGRTRALHNGFVKIAKDTHVPVVPVRIDGAFDCYPRSRKLPRLLHNGKRYRIRISIKNPLIPDEMSGEALKQAVEKAICDD